MTDKLDTDLAALIEANKATSTGEGRLWHKDPKYARRSRMTLLEILDLPVAVLSLPVVMTIALFTGPFRARKQKLNPKQTIAKTLYLHIGYALLRRIVARFSPLQVQAITPTTSLGYKIYAWSKGIKTQTVDLGDGALGHWMGDPNAKNVMVYIHGGGFAISANSGYFTFFDQLLKEMAAANKSFSIFVVVYTLIPNATYPTQLRQSVSALRYILTKTGRKAENVYLGGDSAGGNLTLGVLSHLAHPHPEIEELKLPPGEQIAAATLFSPWTSFEISFPHLVGEPLGDLLHPKCAKPWVGAYLSGRERDNYTDSRLAPIEWWHDIPVKRVLIIAGGYEVLLPLIADFANRLKESFSQKGRGDNVEYFVGPGEAHDAPFFNLYVGDSTETEQGKKFKTFYREVVSD